LAVCGLLIVAAALGVGVGVPLALELRSSRLLEARLQVVKRILKEVPLVDG
jgi:membrane dipeptidase